MASIRAVFPEPTGPPIPILHVLLIAKDLVHKHSLGAFLMEGSGNR